MTIVPVPARRGRPAHESPQDKLARLEKEVAAAREAVREAELRTFVILGEAIAAEIEDNPQFKTTVSAVLRKRVTLAQARADIAPLLVADTPKHLASIDAGRPAAIAVAGINAGEITP